jgi:hypothetical protein
MIEQVETLEAILEPYAGQTVWCSTEDKVYRYDPIEGWQYIPDDTESSVGMSMYNINKQIIAQLPPISEADMIAVKREIIRKYCDQMKAEYYMLLCRDINYYTVFRIDIKLADETIEDVLVDCANYIGAIKSIGFTEDEQALELWMTNEEDTYAAYFFPYDQGVIVCG